MKNKKVLIVSYKLGTDSGVGGRRWLHYGLELLRRGYNIYFLTYESNIPQELLSYKDNVFFIKNNYPKVLKTSPIFFFQKLLYRYWVIKLGLINKGIVYDETVRTKKKFLGKALEIINKKEISHLIVTGAPFSLLHFGSILKEKFPTIKFISDYRDSWTQGIGYGIKQLSYIKFQHELELEKKVLRSSDIVIAASNDIEQALKKIEPAVKIVVLPNFVNIDQYNNLNVISPIGKPSDTIVITHIGSVNNDTSRYWIHFLTNVDQLIKKNNLKIFCQFIGGENKVIREYVSSNKLNFVSFFSNMSSERLPAFMVDSDYFIFFKNDAFPHSFPTKFFDYVFFRKPLLCYSIKGEVTNEIENNKIGIIFNEKTSFDEFKKVLTNFYQQNDFNQYYDYTKYSLVNLTTVLENKLFN